MSIRNAWELPQTHKNAIMEWLPFLPFHYYFIMLLNRVRRHTSQAPLPHTQKRNECVVGKPGNEAMAIHLRHSSCLNFEAITNSQILRHEMKFQGQKRRDEEHQECLGVTQNPQECHYGMVPILTIPALLSYA